MLELFGIAKHLSLSHNPREGWACWNCCLARVLGALGALGVQLAASHPLVIIYFLEKNKRDTTIRVIIKEFNKINSLSQQTGSTHR